MLKNLVLAFISFLAVNSICANSAEVFEGNLLYVAGKSEIAIKPDMAQVSLGVGLEDKKAQIAQKQVSKIMASFMQDLKSLGVQEQEIQTIQNSLNPLKDFSNKKPPYQIKAYKAVQRIRVKITGTNRLSLISKIIDLAAAKQIDQIGGIAFGVSEELRQEANAQALELATQNALQIGTEVLEGLGLSLIKIKEIRLHSNHNRPHPVHSMHAEHAHAHTSSRSQSTEIMTGELIIGANANLVLEFKN